MNILGINISHNASIALFEEGNLTEYYEEDRFLRIKESTIPGKLLSLRKIKNKKIDHVCYTGNGAIRNQILTAQIHNTYFKDIPYTLEEEKHHLYHALCGFYFSKFEDAYCVVLDGSGAKKDGSYEIESLFYLSEDKKEELFAHYSTCSILHSRNDFPLKLAIEKDQKNLFSDRISSGHYFTKVWMQKTSSIDDLNPTDYAGKVMGLSCYDIGDDRLKDLPVEMAKKAQEFLYQSATSLIDLAVQDGKTKNIVLSGGCALNCLNNFKYIKAYPSLRFFANPIAHDGGNSIGAVLDYLKKSV